MAVALVGLPGAGKSAVGRRLGQRLQLPFLDSDQVIEQRIGCSIRDYFEREGESRFRDIEQEVIAELAASATGVVATGGGSVLREANRSQLRTSFHVIYLRSTPEDLSGGCGTTSSVPCSRWRTHWAGCANSTARGIRSTAKPRTTWSRRAGLRSPCSSTSS